MKQMLLLITLVIIGNTVLAQKKPKDRTKGVKDTFEIVYDFKTKLYKKKLVYPIIDYPTVFVIQNINRLAYDVKIESKDSSLMEVAASDFIKTLLPADTTTKVKDNSDKATGGLQDTAKPKQEIPRAQKVVGSGREQINKTDETAKPDKKNITNQITLSNAIANQVALLEKTKATLFDEQTKELELTNQQKSLERIRERNDSFYTKNKINIDFAIDSLSTLITRKQREISKLATDTTNYSNEIKKLINQLDQSKKEAFKLRAELKKYKDDVVSIYNKVEKLKTTYNHLLTIAKYPNTSHASAATELKNYIPKGINDFVATWNNEINKLTEAIQVFTIHYAEYTTSSIVATAYEGFSVVADVKPYLDVVNQIDSARNKANYKKIIEDIHFIAISLSDIQNFKIVSAPIQPKKDMIIFDVNIKSRDTSRFFIHDNRHFKYHDYVRRGIRYDFSTGIALNFGLNDKTYRLAEMSGDSTVQLIKNKDKNGPIPQIAGLFHTSIRTKTLTRIGFTLGTTLNTADFNISTVFVGFSTMFGRSEKYICTVGSSLRRTKVLDGKYEENQIFRKGTISETVLTEQAWRGGFFVAFSYNLTRNQKQ
jgi:hypothetical protein